MNKHLLYWFPILDKDIYGKPYACCLPEIIDLAYERTLLSIAMQMPKQEPISFDLAVRMLSDAQHKAFNGHDIKKYKWLEKNFVKWISEQGYHIEFNGDEFEPLNMPVYEL